MRSRRSVPNPFPSLRQHARLNEARLPWPGKRRDRNRPAAPPLIADCTMRGDLVVQAPDGRQGRLQVSDLRNIEKWSKEFAERLTQFYEQTNPDFGLKTAEGKDAKATSALFVASAAIKASAGWAMIPPSGSADSPKGIPKASDP